ncbi:MAG: hypothetical protein QM760_15800 [Nibricoccus sp.]
MSALAKESKPLLVDFEVLQRSGKDYNGAVVCMKAYYKESDSVAELLSHEPRPNEDWTGKSLWLGAVTKRALEAGAVQRVNSYVIVVGRFENGARGIFGRYFGQVTDVELMLPVQEQAKLKIDH